MLKIKDNVDLKELEKYGFKYDDESKVYYKSCKGTFNKFIIPIEEDLDVFKGQIIFHNESNFQTTLYLDTLYELIQDDLVEQIKEI